MKDDSFGGEFSVASRGRRSGLSRRELLGTVAAAGAGAMLPLHSLWGQGSRTANGEPTDTRPIAPLTAKGGAIDVHHHYLSPLPGGVGNPNWTPEMSLQGMDKYNIAAALWPLSAATPRKCFRDSNCKARKSMDVARAKFGMRQAGMQMLENRQRNSDPVRIDLSHRTGE
jgi:hypothetical protein